VSLESRYRPFTLSRPASAANTVTAPTRTVVGPYRGFIQPRSGQEQQRFNALNEQYTHICYCPVSVPAQYGDLIEQDGTTWRVVFSVQVTGISSVSHHKELLLRYE